MLAEQQPYYAEALCVLGMADAALGNKDDAIREGRRAVRAVAGGKRFDRRRSVGPKFGAYLCVDGREGSCLRTVNASRRSFPVFLSYGELRLHPYWDPLRGDPRFEKIVASLAPK